MSQKVQVAFGVRLQAARKHAAERRINQEELAEVLEVTRTTVSNIERGRHRVFLDQVYVAARLLGVEPADLLPTMEDVFRDEFSTGQAIRPQAARDVQAILLSLTDRAMREVRAGDDVNTTSGRSHKRTK